MAGKSGNVSTSDGRKENKDKSSLVVGISSRSKVQNTYLPISTELFICDNMYILIYFVVKNYIETLVHVA